MYRLGIDIGGTYVKMAVLDDEGKMLFKDSFPTAKEAYSDGGHKLMDDIIAEYKKIAENYEISTIGVGCPGDKDETSTKILSAGNLTIKNLAIVDILSKATGKEVYLDNDGNCAVIAEWLCGGGKCESDVVVVTIGTGIGGGCIVGGDVMRGKGNNAGELGHFVIDPSGPRCPCGQNGCFEQFASATALVRITKEAISENPSSVLAKIAKDEGGVSGKTAFVAAKNNCEIAKKVLDEYAKHLATGINGLCWIFAPHKLLLAGGITKEGEGLLSLVRPYLAFPSKVSIAALGGDAGAIGAALLYIFKDYYLSLR